MFKFFKNIFILAGIAILIGSCTQYLTTPPVGSLSPDGFYNSPAHVEQGILGVYSGLRSIELNQYLLLSEERSDNVWVDPVANGIRSCSEVSNMRFTSSLGDANDLWSDWYSLINNCNAVLGNVDNVAFDNDAQKNQFIGELHFLRGYAHFELARTFGNVPIVDHQLSVSEAKMLKQSSPEDVIAFAIQELQEAETLLPYEAGIKSSSGSAVGGQGRADKIVAEAMLARVYMTLKGWPFNDVAAKTSAKTYLEKVLDYSKQNGNKYWAPNLVEWKKQWLTDPSISNQYQIFSIQHTESSGNSMAGSETGGSLPENYVPKGAQGGLMTPAYIEAKLLYEYMKNSDPRGEMEYFVNGYDAFGATVNPYSNRKISIALEDGSMVDSWELTLITKYLPFIQKHEAVGMSYSYPGNGWPLNFPILRLEDMQLLYAELLIEEGQIAKALEYVNNIRIRAGVPTVSASSPGDALQLVKQERQLELFMEGVRWFDEIRYGEWVQDTKAMFDRYKVDGKYRQGVAIDNVVTEKYLSPIPEAQMLAVPGLYVQNPGW